MESEPSGIAGTAVSPVLLDAAGIAWAKNARGLSAATLAALGVGFGTVYFPELDQKCRGIFFRHDGGWKARALARKGHVSSKGLKAQFWNLANVLAGPLETIYVTEGELDACALVEAGIPVSAVLSAPGARKAADGKKALDVRGYGYVDDALRAGLAKAKRYVFCGDNDEPGRELRRVMARLLGAAKFCFVDWPDGCKDANDYLRSDGAPELLDRVQNGYLLWPLNSYTLDELPERAPMTLWQPGFAQWERKVMLAPRTLSVLTGHPGHGKTLFFGQIWAQVARGYDLKVCIASFETRAKPHYRRLLRSIHAGKLEAHMDAEEIDRADAWIRAHYRFMEHPQDRPDLRWFLDEAEAAVARHKVRVLVLDPWNRLEGGRDQDESETEYIARALRELYSFANEMDCHVQVVAHPAKMGGDRRGTAPLLEDISGSKHWENMCDQGFTVHRPTILDADGKRPTECVLYHRKSRFDELGRPCKLTMNYLLDKGRYVSTEYAGY